MADINSNINVNIDASDALEALKQLQRQISAFQQQMQKSSAQNAAAAANLRNNLINNINATGKFEARIASIKTTTESFTESLEKNKFTMGEYFRFAGASTKTFGKLFKREFDTIEHVARDRVKTLQTQYIQLGRDTNGVMKAIKIKPVALDLKNYSTQAAIANQKQVLLNQLLKQGSTQLLNFGKNTQWAGRQLMVGFTVPLTMFGTAAGKAFMEMEKAVVSFKRVYGDLGTTMADTERMAKEVEALANSFTKYGIAVKDTMEMSAKAAAMGKTGADLIAQVTEATRLAVLGQVEQQQALETTMSLTNAFGTATQDLAKKINFLNVVENQTATSIEDLTIAIPKAAPVIKQLGGDVEDLAFLLTAMKEGGINASEGANALKSGIASLINPTKKSSEFLAGFGINVKGIVEANKDNPSAMIIQFAKSLDTLDPLNRARAIEQMFGKFQFARMSTLFQNVIKDGSQAQKVMDMAKSTAEELAVISERELKRVENSPAFKLEKAMQDLKTQLIPLGREFVKAITPLVAFAGKVLEKFNGMGDGVKQFITNVVGVVGVIGPALLMGFGLLSNGIANLIKLFTFIKTTFNKAGNSSNDLAEQTSYMTQAQLEAAAVAASLDQTHSKLTQTMTVEAAAMNALADAYRRAVDAQRQFGGATVNSSTAIPSQTAAKSAGGFASRSAMTANVDGPIQLASGILKVPGPKGAGDVVPAMLSPGESVIPVKKTQKYGGLIAGIMNDEVPGYENGVVSLGMPLSLKQRARQQEDATKIAAKVAESDYSGIPLKQYKHQLSKTTGHSFPLFGVGGMYETMEGQQVFVKPVMDAIAADAEIRATQIAREAHGLKAPQQSLVRIADPTDREKKRSFLALESPFDPTFSEVPETFTKEDFFKQLVASLLRGDKDLGKGNLGGSVLADVGTAGVFTRASGERALTTEMPSMEEQAVVNLLGVKGGAKKFFAGATADIARSMTPEQYDAAIKAEIQSVMPRLDATIASFGDMKPEEKAVYEAMKVRLANGLNTDWTRFQAMHSGVKLEDGWDGLVAPWVSTLGKKDSNRSHIQKELDANNAQVSKQISGVLGQGLVDSGGLQDFKIVGNLTADLPAWVNNSLRDAGEGLPSSLFAKAWNSLQGKMVSTAKASGLDPSLYGALQQVESGIGSSAAASGGLVKDSLVAKSTETYLTGLLGASGEQATIAEAFLERMGTVGNIRAKFDKQENGGLTADEYVRKGIREGRFEFSKSGLGVFLKGNKNVRIAELRPSNDKLPAGIKYLQEREAWLAQQNGVFTAASVDTLPASLPFKASTGIKGLFAERKTGVTSYEEVPPMYTGMTDPDIFDKKKFLEKHGYAYNTKTRQWEMAQKFEDGTPYVSEAKKAFLAEQAAKKAAYDASPEGQAKIAARRAAYKATFPNMFLYDPLTAGPLTEDSPIAQRMVKDQFGGKLGFVTDKSPVGFTQTPEHTLLRKMGMRANAYDLVLRENMEKLGDQYNVNMYGAAGDIVRRYAEGTDAVTPLDDASMGQTGTKPKASVFDIDDTLLDLSSFMPGHQAANANLPDDQKKKWYQEVNKNPQGIPAGIAALKAAQARGNKILLMTARPESYDPHTLETLAKLGINMNGVDLISRQNKDYRKPHQMKYDKTSELMKLYDIEEFYDDMAETRGAVSLLGVPTYDPLKMKNGGIVGNDLLGTAKNIAALANGSAEVLPGGFSSMPTDAEKAAAIAFVQNSHLAQIQRGDALASLVGKSKISNGSVMYRVPTIRQAEELATKQIGDMIELGDRFTSIADQTQLQAIGETAAGKLDTGNRNRPVNTILKLTANGDLPGIMNHGSYNPNYKSDAFGDKGAEYPFQSEGVLPPGLKGKITGITNDGRVNIMEVLIAAMAKGGTVPGYANGVFSVPGKKGAGDVVPAMLSPGEAVIPADKAAKHRGLIQGMIAGNLPGYKDGLVGGKAEIPAQGGNEAFSMSLEGDLMDRGNLAKKMLALSDLQFQELARESEVYKARMDNAEEAKKITDVEKEAEQRRKEQMAAKEQALIAEMDSGSAEGKTLKEKAAEVLAPEEATTLADATATNNEGTGRGKDKTKFRDKTMGQKKAAFGRGLGRASMALGTAAGIASQIPNKDVQAAAGGMATLAGALPMLSSPMGILTLAITAGIWAFTEFTKASDEGMKKMADFYDSLGTGANAMKRFAEFSGRATAGEVMDKRRKDKMSPFAVQPGKKTFGESYVESEQGKKMTKDYASYIKDNGRAAGAGMMKNQLSTAVMSGAMTAGEARSVAANIAKETGDYQLGIQVNAQLADIMGPNGENLKKDPLKVRMDLMANTKENLVKDMKKNSGKGGIIGQEGMQIGGAALAGAGAGAGAGAIAGAMIGGPIGAAIGAGVGTLVGGAIGAIAGQIEREKRLGTMAGQSVAMARDALEQQQEMIDSLDLEYEKRIAAAKAAGDVEKVEKLTNQHLSDRAKLIQEGAELNQTILDSFQAAENSGWGDKMTSGAMKAIDAKYKDTAMQDMAEMAKNDIKDNSLLSQQQEYQLFLALSTDMDPVAMENLLTTFGGDQDTIDKTLNVMTKFGNTFTGQMSNVASMFVDANGNPVTELQTNLVTQLNDITDPNEAQSVLDMYTMVTQTSEVIPVSLSVSVIQNDPAAQAELIGIMDWVKNYDGKKFTVDTVIQNNVLSNDPEALAVLQDDSEFFNKIKSKEQQAAYMTTLVTSMKVISPDSPELANWLTTPEGEPYALSDPNIQVQEYAQWAAQKVALATVDLSNAPKADDNSSKAPETSWMDDVVKRMRDFVDWNKQLTHGWLQSKKAIKDFANTAVKEFVGLGTKLRGLGMSEGLMSQIMGLSEEEFNKTKKILFDKMGRLTKYGQTLIDAYNKTIMGEAATGFQGTALGFMEQEAALKNLKGSLLTTAETYKLLENAELATALAGTKNVALQKDLIKWFKLSNQAAYLKLSPMEKANKKIESYQAQLDLIKIQEDEVNKKYDEKVKALEEISNLNEDLIAQQKMQLSFADALASGDIAAVAKAAQEMRAAAAAKAVENEKKALEEARKKSLESIEVDTGDGSGPQSRLEIEDKIKKLTDDITKAKALSAAEDMKMYNFAEKHRKAILAQIALLKKKFKLVKNNTSTGDGEDDLDGNGGTVGAHAGDHREGEDAGGGKVWKYDSTTDKWSKSSPAAGSALDDAVKSVKAGGDAGAKSALAAATKGQNVLTGAETVRAKVVKARKEYNEGNEATGGVGAKGVTDAQARQKFTKNGKLDTKKYKAWKALATTKNSAEAEAQNWKLFGDDGQLYSKEALIDMENRGSEESPGWEDITGSAGYDAAAAAATAQLDPAALERAKKLTQAQTDFTADQTALIKLKTAIETAKGNLPDSVKADKGKSIYALKKIYDEAPAIVKPNTAYGILMANGANPAGYIAKGAAMVAKFKQYDKYRSDLRSAGYTNAKLADAGVFSSSLGYNGQSVLQNTDYASFQMFSPRTATGNPDMNNMTNFAHKYYAKGGMVVPKKFAEGGYAQGTDTVPAMLTPGEFVMTKYAVSDFGVDKMKAINSGTYEGESVYNSYEVNVNVSSMSDPDDIARVVMAQIKQVSSKNIRGSRY